MAIFFEQYLWSSKYSTDPNKSRVISSILKKKKEKKNKKFLTKEY